MIIKRKNGFTLIELLIVMGILAGCVLVVIPKVKKAREVSDIKADIKTAVDISNRAIMLEKEGDIISTGSWNKASDIKVLSKDGSERTLAECANVNEKAKAKQLKGCDFYVKLDDAGNVLVSIKEATKKKDSNGEPIDTYVQIYPEVYADEPYRSNY